MRLAEIAGLGADSAPQRIAEIGPKRRPLTRRHNWLREVLSRLLTDDDAAVSNAARTSLQMLTQPGAEISRSVETYGSCDWAALLKELSDLRLTDPRLLAEGKAGATVSQIAALEQRIGRSLPPFLPFLFDGIERLFAPDVFIPELGGTEAVDWFRVRHADWLKPIEIPIRTSARACK